MFISLKLVKFLVNSLDDCKMKSEECPDDEEEIYLRSNNNLFLLTFGVHECQYVS